MFSRIKLLFLLLCAAPLYAAPTVTVTATSASILGTSQSISLTCVLTDPNQTGVLRSGANVITVFSTSTVTPAATATCGPLYGNDVITDGFGNASTTYYLIGVYTVRNGIVDSAPSLLQAYQFAGSGTFDLSATLPFSLGPVSPGGSVLGQNLTFTGTNTATGPWTFGTLIVSNFTGNTTHSGTETFTGAVFDKALNNKQYADQFPGADPCAQIANAIAALGGPNFIGTVDATGFSAAQLAATCAADPFINLHAIAGSSYGVLLLPPPGIPILTNAQWVVPNGWNTNFGKIKAGASFPINTPVLVIGDAAPFTHGAQAVNVVIDCNNVSGSIGVYSNLINETSGGDHLRIDNCQSVGMKIEQTAGHSPQNWYLRDVAVTMGTSSNASSVGILIVGTVGTIVGDSGIDRYTVLTNSSTKLAACVQINNTNLSQFTRGHCEQATNGFETNVGGLITTGISVIGLTGNSSVTNLVKIDNVAGTRNQFFQGIILNGGTNSIVDSFNGITLTDADPALYIVNNAGKPFTTSTNTQSFIGSLAIPNVTDTAVARATTDILTNKSTSAGPLTGVVASGTSTLTVNAALAAVTSQAAITTTATGALTTDSIEWSYASAPTAGDSLCHVSPYVTAGNVNFVRTNPTAAAQNVSALVINWRVIR